MATRIQTRRGSAAAWTAADPILAEGEPGYEVDTGRYKIGDGVTVWSALVYIDADKAPLDSPALTGTPTAPTADPGTNTDQIATTNFVTGAVDNATSGLPDGGTTGQALIKQSGVDGDADWDDTATLSDDIPQTPVLDGTSGTAPSASRSDHVHPYPWGQKFRVGNWYSKPCPNNVSTLAAGDLVLDPWLFTEQVFIGRLMLRLSAVDAATTFRIVFYDDNGNDGPGDLIFDSGDLTGAANNTEHVPPSSIALSPGKVWVGALGQVTGTATFKRLSSSSGANYSNPFGYQSITPSGTAFDPNLSGQSWSASGVAPGAAPNPAPARGTYTSQRSGVQIWLYFAAS